MRSSCWRLSKSKTKVLGNLNSKLGVGQSTFISIHQHLQQASVPHTARERVYPVDREISDSSIPAVPTQGQSALMHVWVLNCKKEINVVVAVRLPSNKHHRDIERLLASARHSCGDTAEEEDRAKETGSNTHLHQRRTAQYSRTEKTEKIENGYTEVEQGRARLKG